MLNLADICLEKKLHLTTYATGCIFHYDKDFPEGSGKGFKETDTPNFTGSYYSYTKVGAPSQQPCSGHRTHACQLHATFFRYLVLKRPCMHCFGSSPGVALLWFITCEVRDN